MSWLFSQALVAEYSEASCSGGTPSVPSNTTPTPQAFLSRDKTTDAWSRFPSGLTCEPLTDDSGEELLKSFRAGFLAKTLVSRARGGGIDASRSGLWSEMARIIGEIRPRFAFVENSPMLTSRGLGRVLGDLAAMGYNARWGVLGATHAGGPHKRERIWIAAFLHADSQGLQGNERGGTEAEAWRQAQSRGLHWWNAEPRLERVANGMAHRVDRLKAIGNGQVPAVAALAWRLLGGPQ
jgi:hypothetical protein